VGQEEGDEALASFLVRPQPPRRLEEKNCHHELRAKCFLGEGGLGHGTVHSAGNPKAKSAGRTERKA